MKKLSLIIALASLLSGATSVNAATLLHSYQFQGNLNDSVGSLALVADGGSVGPSSYVFDNNQGLTLSNGLVSGDSYSIEINFNYSTLSGWQKIVDFNDRTLDSGFYTYGDKLNFYPINPAGSTPLTTGTNADVLITRDSSTSIFTAYLNGVQELAFNDTGSIAVFNAANNVIHFFEDDGATSYREVAPGVVNSIQIWDGALTSGQVVGLTSVPVPGAVWLFASGLGLFSLNQRRKQAK